MDPRRNPLSEKDQRRKQAELAQSTGRQIDKVYGLAYLDDEGIERFFYCGICIDYAKRWKQHYSAILKGSDAKPAYFYARRIGPEHIYMVYLDPDGEQTEREWTEALIELGHPIQNVAATVDSMRKKRGKSELQKEFDSVNRRYQPGELDALVRAARERGKI